MVREDGIKNWGAIGNLLENALGTWRAFYPILWEQIGNRPKKKNQKQKEFAPTHPQQKRKRKKLSPPECGGFHFEFWQFPLRRP
jgi:hypothetical protein